MLGDLVEKALATVGLTSERVTTWLGKPCNCRERRDKLNALDHWAQRVLRGAVDNAQTYLNQLLEEQP